MPLASHRPVPGNSPHTLPYTSACISQSSTKDSSSLWELLCAPPFLGSLVSLGCYTKLPQTGELKQQKCIFHSSGDWEVQDQGACLTRFCEYPLPDLQAGPSSCVLTWWGWGGETSSLVCLRPGYCTLNSCSLHFQVSMQSHLCLSPYQAQSPISRRH